MGHETAMGHIAFELVGNVVNACPPFAEFGGKPCQSRLVDRCAGAVLSECGIRLHKLIEVFPGTAHVPSPQALLCLRLHAGQTSSLSCILAPCPSCTPWCGSAPGTRASGVVAAHSWVHTWCTLCCSRTRAHAAHPGAASRGTPCGGRRHRGPAPVLDQTQLRGTPRCPSGLE